MQHPLACVLLVCLIACLHANPVIAIEDEIDQQHIPPPAVDTAILFGLGVAPVAQTFTVGRGGILSGVELGLFRYRNETLPISVDVRRTVARIPDFSESGLLANRLIAGGELPMHGAPGFNVYAPYLTVGIDFISSRIQVQPDEVLAISLSYAGGSRINYVWWSNAVDASTYDRGSVFTLEPSSGLIFEQQRDFDSVFRTYVAPIPEPSTLALFAIGYALLAFRRR